jgi:hypothetical protein
LHLRNGFIFDVLHQSFDTANQEEIARIKRIELTIASEQRNRKQLLHQPYRFSSGFWVILWNSFSDSGKTFPNTVLKNAARNCSS